MDSPTGRLIIHQPPLQQVAKLPIDPILQKAIDIYDTYMYRLVIDAFREGFRAYHKDKEND